ncbi:MAG: terminase large subunit domain-containing protein, partial [Candidatus Aminicenantaceae bacterium]
MDIIKEFKDPKTFGSLIKNQETWANWKVCLKAIFALSMTDKEKKVYRKFTGRKRAPTKPFKEVFLIIGRRGGKSFISALISVYLACFKSWHDVLGPGEKGYIMVLACDKKQAGVIFNYIKEILNIPILKTKVLNEKNEEIELRNGIVISVHTSSYRSLRGYTILAAICDELAFWRSEYSANPDKEILTALRPSLGNVEDSILLGISTGYSRTGVLYEAFRDKYGTGNPETLVWKASTLDMNPTYSKTVIKKALKEDPSAAQAEYCLGSGFREDLETFLSTEALEAVI